MRGLVVCEVGVARGDNALCMLKSLDIKKLYLVDPYIEYVENSDNVEIVSNVHVQERDIARGRLSTHSI